MQKKYIKYLTLIIGFNFISSISFGQNDFLESSKDINSILMKNTFRIEGMGSCGTGFVIGKMRKNNSNKTNSGSPKFDLVLITAAHVLDSIKGNKAIIYLRTQSKDVYKTYPFPVLIRKDKTNFYTRHLKMDVAAMYIELPDLYSGKNLIFLTDYLSNDSVIKYWNIKPGETLNCLGYPFCYDDTLGNFPVLRSGKIASFPLVPSDIYKTFNFDFEVFPGNSGGPVYFYNEGTIPRVRSDNTFSIGKENVQFIMGLVTESRHAVLWDNKGLKKSTVDLKLAVVIHASYILETINMLP